MSVKPEKLLSDLIALPSVNPAFLPEGDARAGEWRVSEFLETLARKAGLSVEYQGEFPGKKGVRKRENLLVRMSPRTRATQRVFLAPHLDTVSAEKFKPCLRNGRIYGRGACDTKGSVAAMFAALLNVARQGQRPLATEVIFAGLVDEENAQEGSRALGASKLKADLAIVGEPTELKVVTAHKGDMWLRLATRGKAAHGARPELGRNAVHAMARVIDVLETDYARELATRKHPLLGSPTINVGAVRGGTQPNIVPDHCEIQIDRRTIPGERDASVQREIVQFLRRAGERVELVSSKEKPCLSLETDPNLPLIRQFMAITKQNEAIGVDFFCDAANLSAGGTPSVVFGPGNIAQAHTVEEWVAIRSLHQATEILTRFLCSLP